MIQHMRKAILTCGLVASLFLAGCGGMKLTADNAPPAPEAALTTGLNHPWLPPQCEDGGCTLLSSVAPVIKPPAMVAVLTFAPYKGANTTLSQIMDEQVENIRTNASPTEYLDNDGHHVRDNIATWKSGLGDHDVGYIKHFMQQGGVNIMVRHAIVFDAAGKAYLIRLLSLDEPHRAEVLADQDTLINHIAAQGAATPVDVGAK